MNITKMIRSTRNVLKRSALGLAAVAVLGMGVASAQAAPPVTTGLIVSLAADDVNTGDPNQVRTSGSDFFVKQWNDQSGLGNHATQTTEGNQPKYIASGVGGMPVLRFTQVNDDAGSELKLGDLSAQFPTAGSMFAVATINSDGRYNLFENRDNDSRWVADTWNEAQPGVFRGGRTASAGSYADWPQTGSHVFAMESSSSLYRFVIDGTQIGSTGGNYHSGSGQNWTIGDRVNNGQQLNGDIAELLIYNRVLTTEEANQVGGYLAQKYELTTVYPPLGLTAKVTVPKNGSDYLVGADIPATATAVAGTTPYDVEFFLDSGSGFVSQGTVTDPAPYTKNLTGLAIGAYSLYVTVTDDASATADSATIAFTVSNAGPTGLAAVPGNELVNLSWNQVLGATGYTVLRSTPDNASYSEVASAITELTYQDTGLENGTLYYYVVKATVGATVSNPSNEINVRPSAVDAGLSSVVGYLAEVWADGTATSTITVTLKNGGDLAAPNFAVTLVASGTAVIAPTEPVTTDENGVATFTVTCTDPGMQEFTATADLGVAGSLEITEKGTVLFKTKPDDLSVYVPANLPAGGAVTVRGTWDAGTGWGDWSNWDGGNSYDVYGNKVLGTVGGARGAMFLYDVRTKLPAMSYFNSGIEVTYIGSSHWPPGNAAWAELLTWDNQDGPGRKGFIIQQSRGPGTVRTYAMTADGQGPSQDWPAYTDTVGLHTMTILRLSNGDVQAYVDGVLRSTMTGTLDPGRALTMLGFGYEYTGNCYMPFGTIVEQVKAFTVSFPVGDPDADNSTVVASPVLITANGTDTSTVTVTLKDADGNRVEGKEVTLSSTGPGAVTITPAQTTGISGQAVFTVQPTTTTAGIYAFTATVTDPAVVITQKAALSTGLTIVTTVLDVSGSGTGLEILNDGTLIAANHFGEPVIGDVTVNGVLFGTSWAHMTSGWNTGGQWTKTDAQGRVPNLTDATDFGKLMREYIWTGGNPRVDIPDLTVGKTYRLQWITSSPRGGNISVEGSASVPLTPIVQPASNYPMVLTFTWVAADTTANVLVTRQAGSYNSDSEPLFNGYALHEMPTAPVGTLFMIK